MTEEELDPDLEVEAALERVIEGATAHLAAMKAAGGEPDDAAVWNAFVELNNACANYDGLVQAAFGEVTPWELAPINEESAGQSLERVSTSVADDLEDHEALISVRQRRDFRVPSVRALLRIGEFARMSSGDKSATEPLASVGEAIVEIMQTRDGTLNSLSLHELEPLAGVVTISEVHKPLDLETLPDDDDESPFQTASGDTVLCRIDERVLEDHH